MDQEAARGRKVWARTEVHTLVQAHSPPCLLTKPHWQADKQWQSLNELQRRARVPSPSPWLLTRCVIKFRTRGAAPAPCPSCCGSFSV